MASNNIGRFGSVAIKKESQWGELESNINIPLKVSSESIEAKKEQIEDNALVSKRFKTNLYNVAESVTGGLELLMHPEEIGRIIAWTLGSEGSVSNPVTTGFFLFYEGTENYARVRVASDTMTAETSEDNSTWNKDTNFGSGGDIDLTDTDYDTIEELVEAINSYTGYKAFYFGDGAVESKDIGAFTNYNLKSLEERIGLLKFITLTSTVSKCHNITEVQTSTNLPSYSILINRTLGTNKSIGYSGCKVNTLTLTYSSKEANKVSIDVTGKQEYTDQNDVSLTTTDLGVMTGAKTKVYIDGVEVTAFKDLTLTITNNLDSTHTLGSEYINEQVPQGSNIELSGTINLDTTLWGYRSKYTNGEKIQVCIYTEAYKECEEGIYYNCFINIPALKITNFSTLLNTQDRLTISFTATAVVNSLANNHIYAYVNDKNTTTY